ncbi:MAG: DUF2946 family protein [Beijerinckiaceae bacterium]
MIEKRRELLPGWRAGLLVLGLYAMLLQAFLGALVGPAQALASADRMILCTSSGEASAPGHEPATPHAGHECVCAALCHGAGALAPSQGGQVEILRFEIDLAPPLSPQRAFSLLVRALPPARAPPRNGFVLKI